MENPRQVRLHLWPDLYAVARLKEVPDLADAVERGGPPVSLVVGHDEVSLIAPQALLDTLSVESEEVSTGWRALTLDAVLSQSIVGLLAAVADALARIDAPLMAFSSHDTDHFLIPDTHLGRALAALNQVNLERFVSR